MIEPRGTIDEISSSVSELDPHSDILYATNSFILRMANSQKALVANDQTTYARRPLATFGQPKNTSSLRWTCLELEWSPLSPLRYYVYHTHLSSVVHGYSDIATEEPYAIRITICFWNNPITVSNL